MERMTVRNRFASLNLHTSVQRVPCGISPDFSGLSPCCGLDTRYSPVRRSPSFEASFKNAAPRLACVRPVASVHPEPGSNSSLYYFFFYNSIENFAFSPSKGAARDSPVLTLTFLLVSYYFVYHSLKDLSPFSSPLLSQCVSVIPEKRVQR